MAGSASPRDQLDALTGAVEDLAGQFDLQPLLERILRRAVELLGGGAGSICTVDEQAGTYRKEADLGVACQQGRVFPLAEGTTGAVVARRGPVVFESYSEVRGGHVAGADRARLHATVAVPIEWAGAIIGSCVVFSTDEHQRFGDTDVALLGLFAKHAAIAIINARLHEEAAVKAQGLAVAAERERVVRDVHDAVARALGSIVVHLDRLEVDEDQLPRLVQAREAARVALAESRRTVLGLAPALLETRSLEDAFAMELAWVRSIVGIRTDLVVTGEGRTLAPDVSQQALRVVQEALTNVVSHARAHRVRVGLIYGSDDVLIVVEDDGQGFDIGAQAAKRGEGIGLNGIVARARMIGAGLEIESTPGWGTRLRAQLAYEGNLAGSTPERRALWRVLLVNHIPLVRAGLGRLLSRAEPDIQVVGEIGDARDVVDAVRVLEPDVVLVELEMPAFDGARLTSYIRAANPAVSVLLVSNGDDDARLREAITAGARGCVSGDTSTGRASPEPSLPRPAAMRS